MNGVTLMQPSGVPPTPPNPRSPEGFRNPAQPAPEPMPWAGFSLGAEARGCAPKTSHSARAPRRLFLKRAADVDRGRSREAPRGVARMAPDSREKLAGARLHEDGGRARADRAGDRALAAAGADEIAPGSCAAPAGARSGLANALIPADSSLPIRYPAKRPWLERGSNAIR